jgi:hypothetical protein
MEDYIPIKSEYDKIDVDNKFLTIHECNIIKYLERYGCKNELELEDCLWINYGITLKII